jgi:selenide, water dikinase
VLFLTKPLGTGIVGTAIKFDRVDAALAAQAVASMRTLNRAAAEALLALRAGSIHACTDITGFGLIGHASEMARASGVTVVLDCGRVPLFDGVLSIAGRNHSGGMESNREHFSGGVEIDRAVNADSEALLYDPQTSGGLLVAAAGEAADEVGVALRAGGVTAWRVGKVVAGQSATQIVVQP